MIRILYFASLRERVGLAEESLPADASLTVADLLERLRSRGEPWASALAADVRIMAAVNQEIARPETPVADGDEVAFFPPVTGG
jgi:molybdopterin synthase sulfur carrier subunit